MASYLLTNKAVEDLSSIWEYTFDTWSERQADKYYLELLQDCQLLAENQNLGRNYEKIHPALFGYKSGEHLIFFRKLSLTQIEITRILHASMDLKNRIQE